MSDTLRVLDALDSRYSQNAGARRNNEQWVVIREARSGAGFDGNRRQCDYLAINTHRSRGLQLIGHEVKVSMQDWKRELADPDKAELFARHCRRWWIAAPSDLAQKIKDEVPPTWGLMSVSDKGRITEITAAPAREPASVSDWWWIGWLAQLDRAEKRQRQADIERLVNEQVEKEIEYRKQHWESRRDYRTERIEKAAALIERLRDETGIDLHHAWEHDIERLAQLWPLVRNGTKLDQAAQRLRESADLLDSLAKIGEFSE